MHKLYPFLATTLFLVTSVTPAYAHPWKYHVGRSAQAHEEGANGEVKNESDDQFEQESEARENEIESKVSEFKSAQEEKRVSVLKDLCEKMIDHRLKELDRVQERVDSSDLTDTEKEELKDILEENDNALDAAKEDCANATTQDSLKTLVRGIQTKHHIFASVLPKLHGQRFLDKAIGFIGRLTNHVATMQKHIDRVKADGCDTTGAEAALAAYQAAVQSAQDHLNTAKGIIAQIKETQDAGTLREQLKGEMKAMVDALHDARDAHKDFIKSIKACKTTEEESESSEPTEPTSETEPST